MESRCTWKLKYFARNIKWQIKIGMKKGMKLQLNNPIFIVKPHSYQFQRLIFHQKYQKLPDQSFRFENIDFEPGFWVVNNHLFKKEIFLIENCYFCEILSLSCKNSQKKILLKKFNLVENRGNCHFLQKYLILILESCLTERSEKVFLRKSEF